MSTLAGSLALRLEAQPLELFVVPEAAGCSVTEAEAQLIGEEHGHEQHGHEEHAEEGHEGHSEFHAAYVLTCADPDAFRQIDFAYFTVFPNGRELEVHLDEQYVLNKTRNERYGLRPLGDVLPIIEAGGIFAYAKQAGMLK